MVHKLIRGRLSMPGRIRTEAMRIEREVADRLLCGPRTGPYGHPQSKRKVELVGTRRTRVEKSTLQCRVSRVEFIIRM